MSEDPPREKSHSGYSHPHGRGRRPAGTASAALRSTQVTLSGGNLQDQVNALNGSGIDVTADQEDFMRWGRNKTGAGTFTLSFAFNGGLGENSIGVYNAVADDGIVPSGSDFFEIFPASTPQAWYALAQFNLDNTLDVTLFDSNDNIVSGFPVHYTGVHVNDFGFYIRNQSSTGHGQDLLNTNDEARVLVLPGTGVNNGGWYLCFEDGVPSVPQRAGPWHRGHGTPGLSTRRLSSSRPSGRSP
jgi:hypothetical protein